MKQFGSFVKKEFLHIFRDLRTMMLLLAMPVIQMILFGFAVTTEVKNSQVAVYDPSKSISTKKMTDRINSSKYFDVIRYLNNPTEIEHEFRKNKVGLAVVFDENFDQNLLHSGKAQVQLIADATDPNTATTLTNYAGAIIMDYQQDLMQRTKIPFQILPETKMLYNPQMKGAYNFVPGVLGLILMLICAMMTSIAIVREKEMGTMEILLVSPLKPIYIILAKMVPYFLLSCINLSTVLLLAVYVLDVPVAGSLFWLLVVSMLFIFVALSLGLLVSTVTQTQMAAMLVSGMIFMMPIMLLSGMIFPVENMPQALQWLSNIIPAKWYIIAVKNIMIKGSDVSSIYKEIMILGFMAAVILTVSLKNFKNRLE
ncbi:MULTISPECIES: ABC transporter permease [Flavobacterium]|uniref:ABC transporter permease n=1 Tax=Flavobacterium TaxID=237 RepID=UPI001FCB83CE|nr:MULTISPECIES: ABC transporter permease [Flavobacterium]UOK41996.1 ABC transporter permease [Flavobacterium enshiense]